MLTAVVRVCGSPRAPSQPQSTCAARAPPAHRAAPSVSAPTAIDTTNCDAAEVAVPSSSHAPACCSATASRLTSVSKNAVPSRRCTAISPISEANKLKNKLEQAEASAQRPVRVTDAEFAVRKMHDAFIAAQARPPLRPPAARARAAPWPCACAVVEETTKKSVAYSAPHVRCKIGRKLFFSDFSSLTSAGSCGVMYYDT